MNAFWIFVAGLTAVYAVYYTVLICVDLMHKPKDQRLSSEETFDVGDLVPESSCMVEETDDGFRVSDEGGSVVSEQQLAIKSSGEDSHPGESEDAPRLDATGAVITPARKKADAVQADMDEVEPEQSTELLSSMYMSALVLGKPDVPIDKTVIPGAGGSSEAGKEKEAGDGVKMHT